ncbi:MAG: carbohydrate binding family 9 domain-containing protein, partial [Planctomycetota bacterium]
TLFFLINTGSVPGAEGLRSVAAVRIQTPPFIDGRLDDECWSKANVATNFTDYRLERLAVEQTLVRILYDDENIYFGFECIEPDPNKIVGTERKYDQSLREEDRIEVRLDTFHDHRCAYVFAVNTLGTRYDARMGLSDEYDDTWGCDWTAACTVGKDRWFAEIAIPINNLLYEQKDRVTWGVNFRRSERGLQESSYWSYPTSQARYAREYGHLTNLDLGRVKIRRNPAFETYISGTLDLKDNDNDLSTGLDAALRLSPELTSAFTINPDYGQVEADPDTIELRDTERFLRERRTFFREGSELFHTPLIIYYSRRFMDIDMGAKITGQGKRWALGLIDVQGEIEREDSLFDGNYHVGRLIYNVGEKSHIGGIWTTSFRDDGSNITGGLDTRLFLDNTTSITTQFVGMEDSEGIITDDDEDDNGYGLYSALKGGTQPLWWQVDYRDISRGFQPDLGYIPRRDIRGPGYFIRYRENFADGAIKTLSAISEFDIYQDNNNETTLRDFVEGAGVCFRNEIELWYTRGDKFHAPFKNWYDRIRIEYNEDVDIWESVSFGIEKGEFEEEPYKEFFLDKPMRITERLLSTFSGNFRRKDPIDEDDEEDIWLWRWVTQYTFIWNGRIKFTAEETSEDRHNLTILFSWPMRKNMDLYLLYNDYITDVESVRAAFAKLVYRF